MLEKRHKMVIDQLCYHFINFICCRLSTGLMIDKINKNHPLSLIAFILYNQQSSQTFRNLQQSANAKLVVVSLQCRKEQGGTDIKATAGRRK